MATQAYGRKKTARRVLRTSGKPPELHCMVAPTEGNRLLLPTSVISEVIDFRPPLAMEFAPPWLLGHVEWENRQVPVFSFTGLIDGVDPGPPPPRSKIMIVKSLAETGRVPYLGILLTGLPRPVTVKPDDIEQTGDERKALGVFSRVVFEDDEAIVPELDRLTHLVTHAAFGALPITQLEQ